MKKYRIEGFRGVANRNTYQIITEFVVSGSDRLYNNEFFVNQILERNDMPIEIYTDEKTIYSGRATIEAFEENYTMEQAASYSLTLKTNGAITHGR